MKKYSTAPAQGFTLVELIVVIVILAILATIAFLSFGSQSAAARDSKRKTDLSNIASKMNIAMANGTSVTNLATSNAANTITSASIGGAVATASEYVAGTINFNVLGVNATDFKDADGSNTYKIGTTSKAGTAFQLAATLENDNAGNSGKNPFLVGNYSARTIAGTTLTQAIASGSTTVSLPSAQVGMYKKGDSVLVVGSTTPANTVANVSSDLATVTLTNAVGVTPGTAMTLAADEIGGLVASGGVNTAAVVANGTACPY